VLSSPGILIAIKIAPLAASGTSWDSRPGGEGEPW